MNGSDDLMAKYLWQRYVFFLHLMEIVIIGTQYPIWPKLYWIWNGEGELWSSKYFSFRDLISTLTFSSQGVYGFHEWKEFHFQQIRLHHGKRSRRGEESWSSPQRQWGSPEKLTARPHVFAASEQAKTPNKCTHRNGRWTMKSIIHATTRKLPPSTAREGWRRNSVINT